jgi:DNA modification methylase
MARILRSEMVPITTLSTHPRNVRQGDVGAIAQSLTQHGQYRPVTVQRSTNQILAGNHTFMAARSLGWHEINAVFVECDDDEALRILLADNRAADLADYDQAALADLLAELAGSDEGLEGTLYDGDDVDQVIRDLTQEIRDEEMATSASTGALAERFGMAPFSILDTRRGWWRNRRDRWLSLGIESEIGRAGNLLRYSDTVLGASGREENLTLPPSAIFRNKTDARPQYNGTSVFDPVVCEIAYRWFAPKGGAVLDPFAGGSVRGVVAAQVGLNYTGIELRSEQVEANRAQLDRIGAGSGTATWHEGDSYDLIETLPGQFDLVFSCPPYHDLEQYSDDPRDLSAIGDYTDFMWRYTEIIQNAVDKLRDDSFAVWMISEIRSPLGNFKGFVPDTIAAFEGAGAMFYNEMVYIQAAGSWPLRIGRAFGSTRKVARLHQNLLVFVKGDAGRATERCGEPEWGFENEPEMVAEMSSEEPLGDD